METAEVDQFGSSSCETFFSGCWLPNVDLSINDMYGNQFGNGLSQK